MNDPNLIFIFLCLICGGFYFFIIILYTFGWFKLKTYTTQKAEFHTPITIIIPARNEEKNINNILSDILKQKYPSSLFEVIVVDDNSTDGTAQAVQRIIEEKKTSQVKLIHLVEDNPNHAFKKKAINTAIENASGKIIITTDADCRMKDKWLSSLVSFYENEHPKMIVGPVSFHNESSFFQNMQTLEFLSLIAITGGAIRIGRPIMCNGANLVYEKKAFEDVGRFGNDEFSSGDDVFLLLKIRKRFGADSVRFLKNRNSFVFTEAKKSIKEFYHQRTRWASKNKGYDLKIILVSATVFMTNLLIVAGLLLSMFYTPIFISVIIAMLLKTLIEAPILIGIAKFSQRSNMFKYSFPLIFIYPFYIVIVGTLGIIGNYQWKGRKVKK